MKKIFNYLVFFTSLFFPFAMVTKPLQATEKMDYLSLEGILELFKRENPIFALKRLELESEKKEGLDYFPRIEGEWSLESESGVNGSGEGMEKLSFSRRTNPGINKKAGEERLKAALKGQQNRASRDIFKQELVIRRHFVESLLFQESLKAKRDHLQNLDKIREILQKRVKGGDFVPFDHDLFSLEYRHYLEFLKKGEADLNFSLGSLARQVGVFPERIPGIIGSLSEFSVIPPFENLVMDISSRNFDLLEFQIKREVLDKKSKEARVQRGGIPRMGLGYIRERGNSNQQGIYAEWTLQLSEGQETRYHLDSYQARRLELDTSEMARLKWLSESLQAFHTSYNREKGLLEKSRNLFFNLPQELASRAEKIYQSGELGILDLLKIHQKSLDSRLEWLKNSADLHLKLIEIQELVGGPLK